MAIKWNTVAHELGFKNEKEMWVSLYVEKGLPITALAERLSVSYSTIWSSLQRCGIPRRPQGGKRGMRVFPPPQFFDYLSKNGIYATAEHFHISPRTVYLYLARFDKLSKVILKEGDGDDTPTLP